MNKIIRIGLIVLSFVLVVVSTYAETTTYFENGKVCTTETDYSRPETKVIKDVKITNRDVICFGELGMVLDYESAIDYANTKCKISKPENPKDIMNVVYYQDKIKEIIYPYTFTRCE